MMWIFFDGVSGMITLSKENITDYMKEKIPDIVISSDIIVGFPGETEEDFEGTLEALRRVRFDMI